GSRTCARVAAPNAAAFRARLRWSHRGRGAPRSVPRRGRPACYPATPTRRLHPSTRCPRSPAAHAPRGSCRPRCWHSIGMKIRTSLVSMTGGRAPTERAGNPWTTSRGGTIFAFVFARMTQRTRDEIAHGSAAEAANPVGGSRASRGLRLPAWRGHGHVPLAAAAVAAVRMRMAGCQARTNEVAKEVHGPSPQSSAAAPRGTGRTRLVEAGTSRPGAVAADRFDFCRRHPMQAGAGGATRVYVHGLVKWRTVPVAQRALWRAHCRAGRA